MSLQIDGNLTLAEQELQLQVIESFFVEVVDYVAGSHGNNDPTTKPVMAPVTPKIRIAAAANSAAVGQIATAASTVVFDRIAFVSGTKTRVVGYRP